MATAISMAYVSPAVVVKRKTETRRHWTPEYARRFKKGDILDAYSHAPRYGGVKIASLRLTANPYKENMSVHNTEEKFLRVYEAEGFAYMDEPEEGYPLIDLMAKWIELGEELWVVPFDIISVEEGMVEKFCTKAKLKKKREKLIDALLGEDMRDDLLTPQKPKMGDVQQSVKDAVMEDVVKNTMAQGLPKCEWCGKDAIKTFTFKADKKIYNICPECNKLPEEGRWGEVASYLGHIPKDDGKRIDEEEGTKKIEPPAISSVPPPISAPLPKPTAIPTKAPTPVPTPTATTVRDDTPQPLPRYVPRKDGMKGFWICNGCGATVPDDMACNICHYTREKSMREIEEAQKETEEWKKTMHENGKAKVDTGDQEDEEGEEEEEEEEPCPHCGGEIDGDVCKGCGASIVSDDELEEGQVVCNDCYCVLEADEMKCPECGKSRVKIEKELAEEEDDA